MVNLHDVAHCGLVLTLAGTAFGCHGIYDVTVRRGSEVVAELRGRSATVPT